MVTAVQHNVGLGQIQVARNDEMLTSILGSCIGVVIYDQSRRIAAFAHVVLPTSGGRPGSPGRFADSAVPAMLQQLRNEGANPQQLRAKITGGACMFGNSQINIGERNAEEVRRQLKEKKIPLIAEDVGGAKGRKVHFSPQTSQLEVVVMGVTSTII
ncbi:chemotaxis protein CheD [Blastopirellula marina]|uniref:Probable chemoreceptor glutamine deamidase CheD n=1 Tax=Blastopirellula marina DSM 3645 TaxID=314230 RepID=A3ZQH2_9BACT|nr:chemotaxis protein CheD [Blastopirellula marina]EAQ81448.1 protein required for methylation of methyl-accepting chemotaxis protein (MCPs) [Blastopirellula marina DSM 3645]